MKLCAVMLMCLIMTVYCSGIQMEWNGNGYIKSPPGLKGIGDRDNTKSLRGLSGLKDIGDRDDTKFHQGLPVLQGFDDYSKGLNGFPGPRGCVGETNFHHELPGLPCLDQVAETDVTSGSGIN